MMHTANKSHFLKSYVEVNHVMSIYHVHEGLVENVKPALNQLNFVNCIRKPKQMASCPTET